MRTAIKVDFHCHSTHSDGGLTPEQLATRLRAAGVAYAALTDHDTTEGLASFKQAADRTGIGVITGVEITTWHRGREAHILAYGFDPGNLELQQTLRSIRRSRSGPGEALADSVRDLSFQPPQTGAAPGGRLDSADAVALIHRAGGRAFLAHPLSLEPCLEKLEEILWDLKKAGLDGIEALCAQGGEDDRRNLVDLARWLGLLVSAGSDFHVFWAGNSDPPGVVMPIEQWRQFRAGVCGVRREKKTATEPLRAEPIRLRRRHFFLHVVFPTLLAIALFAGAFFVVLLPGFERSLIDKKREMIRELTSSAWSILAECHEEEQRGNLTRQQAQDLARRRIEHLRYGREGKDYFWLQDLHPHIIVHPYRSDLNGKDVSQYLDPNGVRIFVEFADLVRRQGEGHIKYVWQWQDDPTLMKAKESYIKGFTPWGWAIGTGLYIEDVGNEIALTKRHFLGISAAILTVIILLLISVMASSLRIESARRRAEEGLRESNERYRSVVEATTEGTLLVIENRCCFANTPLLEMLGYSERELDLLSIEEVLPAGQNTEAWEALRDISESGEPGGGIEGALRRRDGEIVACLLSVNPIRMEGREGFVLLARQKAAQGQKTSSWEQVKQLARLAESAAPGLFRAELAPPGLVVSANLTALSLMVAHPPGSCARLADAFAGDAGYADFIARLEREGQAECILHVQRDGEPSRTVRFTARLDPGGEGQAPYIDGCLEDVTERARWEAERDELVSRLQSSLLFLHEPLAAFGETPLIVDMLTPVREAAALMTSHPSSAVLVAAEGGLVTGIATDRDLRARVIAEDRIVGDPVYLVMTSPVHTIGSEAQVYEALLMMEEKGVQHLAVTDENGRIVRVVCNNELLLFRSYGVTVLTREIRRASRPEKVAELCRRAPELAKALLHSGASPRNITHMLTAICDEATSRLTAMAAERLGPPPCPFAFMAIGSHGRQEFTLFSDQDNAIVYMPPPGADEEGCSRYFQEPGRLVNGWLEQAGYPLCRGEAMARNPQWCQPLNVWVDYFRQWILKAEPIELRRFSIFFDFRAVCGAAELVQELSSQVQALASSHRSFFPPLAESSLQFKAPMRLFGRIIAGTGLADNAGQISLKEAMMPIVSFARIYALRHGIQVTHTLDRLEALAAADVLQASSLADLETAYAFLMRLRLRKQLEAPGGGRGGGEPLAPGELGLLDETLLGQYFLQIGALQKRIGHDFLGR